MNEMKSENGGSVLQGLNRKMWNDLSKGLSVARYNGVA